MIFRMISSVAVFGGLVAALCSFSGCGGDEEGDGARLFRGSMSGELGTGPIEFTIQTDNSVDGTFEYLDETGTIDGSYDPQTAEISFTLTGSDGEATGTVEASAASGMWNLEMDDGSSDEGPWHALEDSPDLYSMTCEYSGDAEGPAIVFVTSSTIEGTYTVEVSVGIIIGDLDGTSISGDIFDYHEEGDAGERIGSFEGELDGDTAAGTWEVDNPDWIGGEGTWSCTRD